jgi:putative ABC transport system substrate-binding protein
MKRREFLGLAAGAAASSVSWPMIARAQQPAMPVIGVLFGVPSNTPIARDSVAALRDGLRGSGFIDGRNIAIEYRWAEGQYDRLPALAGELAHRPVAVLVAIGAPAATAAKAATTTVPVVFYMGEDPVHLGLVPSISRPGGNVTGVAYLSSAVLAKRLELLREIVPGARVIAALVNPKNPNVAISTWDAHDAARKLARDIHVLSAGSESELDAAFAMLGQTQAGALLIAPDGFFNIQAGQLAALAARYAMPASHEIRAFAAAGGLMSYGGSLFEGLRQTGSYAARILKGEKDLPIMQPTKFELVINLKAAKALGLDVPMTVLATADEVIE